jgi:hypothetical protein
MNFIITISFLIAGIFLEKKYKVHLFRSLKERLTVTVLIFVVLMGWEFINSNIFKAWLYPGPGMIGVYIFGLPLELYLFYIAAPYFSFIVYELIHREVDR